MRVAGDLSDFVHDVWVRLLFSVRNGKMIGATLATVVLQACEWEMVSPRRIGKKSVRDVWHRIRRARRPRSTDRQCEYPTPVDVAETRLLENVIAGILRSLSWREAVIIRARFGLFGDQALSIKQCAVALRISRSQVSQIEAKAITKLKHHTRAGMLLPFVDIQWHRGRSMVSDKRLKEIAKTDVGRALLSDLFGVPQDMNGDDVE